MKYTILKYICLFLCLGGMMMSCVDDAWDQLPGQGIEARKLVKVGIPFKLSRGFSAEIITKAAGAAENQTGRDSQLSGIMMFVFENKGDATGASENFLQFKLFSKPGAHVEGATDEYWIPDPSNPTQGHFTAYLPTGNVYIYLVGNAKSSFVDDIFAKLQNHQGHDLQTRQDFLKKVVPIWTGNMYAIDGYLPMTGKVDNADGTCVVSIDPTLPGGDRGIIKYKDRNGVEQTIGGAQITDANSFILSRIMSKVSMEFISDPQNPNLKFIPKTYKFYHCPIVIPPVEDFRDSPYYPDSLRDTETVQFDAQSPNRFLVYLPENIRKYTGTKPLTFKDRDKVVKDAQGMNQYETEKGHEKHYRFEHAPQKSTYVEVSGHLENTQTNHSADVRYIIHLGDFSQGDFTRFSLERDWHYHYRVTVKGAKDILVEVLGPKGDGQHPQEQNPAVEGVIFTGGARIRLDAHYEQVEMKFGANQFQNGVFVYADTPFGKVHCKYMPTTGALATDYPNSHDLPTVKKLLEWVEFKKQTRKGVLAKYQDATPRMSVIELLNHIQKNPANAGYYTCFVNEYYYNVHPLGQTLQLSDFVNAPERAFGLASKISYSADKMSAVAQAVYVLQQSSIATFYDLNDKKTAKYGVELVDELGKLPYGKPLKTGLDVKYGRENCAVEIQNVNQAVNWEQNGYLLDRNDTQYQIAENRNRLLSHSQEAHLACLARNRDFNGDGLVTPDELRWYTPARDQVFGLWIGEPAMPKGAALYPYNTANLQANSSVCQYPIFTSTGGENRVVWGEQGCSYGDEKSAANGGYVRVIRNLGRGDFTSTQETNYLMKAEPYYHYDPVTRTIELYLTQTALRAFTARELSPHHERESTNKPYRKFQVAKQPYIREKNKQKACKSHAGTTYGPSPVYDELGATIASQAKTDATTMAANYREGAGYAYEATWRLPNQREMLLMIVAMGTKLDYDMDNKAYHTRDYDCGRSFIIFGYRHYWTEKTNYILHCRTSFSNKNYAPVGYMYNTQSKKIQMMHDTGGAGPEGWGGYLCVRDVR